MHQIEKWANAIANNLPSHSDNYEEASKAIVEPTGLSIEDEDAYIEFMENDTDNWANWIKCNFGEDWGKIATKINEEGY
jgi:hypothetical protein